MTLYSAANNTVLKIVLSPVQNKAAYITAYLDSNKFCSSILRTIDRDHSLSAKWLLNKFSTDERSTINPMIVGHLEQIFIYYY